MASFIITYLVFVLFLPSNMAVIKYRCLLYFTLINNYYKRPPPACISPSELLIVISIGNDLPPVPATGLTGVKKYAKIAKKKYLQFSKNN